MRETSDKLHLVAGYKTSPPSLEKLSMKLVPGTKRVRDHYFIGSNVFIYVHDGRSLQGFLLDCFYFLDIKRNKHKK